MKMELNVHSGNMIRWGKEHPEAVVLSGDLGSSCEIKEFRSELPEQYFSMGLTEQNMVGWAAGLAREGFLSDLRPPHKRLEKKTKPAREWNGSVNGVGMASNHLIGESSFKC